LKQYNVSAANLSLITNKSVSNEILLGNLGANPTVGVEPPLVVEEKNERGRNGRLLFLITIAIGTIALASLSLLVPVTYYSSIGSRTGSVGDDDSSIGGDSAALPSESLASSARAIDGEGTAIENNGISRSAEMTISGYSDSTHNTKLLCAINSLPAYCSGSPVTFSGLPPGEHIFTVTGSGSDKTAAVVHSFSWNILE
jgi:hypothetical protein